MGTKITSKFQTTIPKKVRKLLDVRPGKEIEWDIVKGMVIVDTKRKIDHPVEFLTSQITINIDAVELVKYSRNDFR